MKTVGQQHKILFGVLFGVLAMNASVMNTAQISTSEGVAHLGSNEIARQNGPAVSGQSSLPREQFDYIRSRSGQTSGTANDESYRQQVRCESGDRGFRIPDHVMDIDFAAAEDDENFDEDEDRPGRQTRRSPSDNPNLTPAQLAEVAVAASWSATPIDCDASAETPVAVQGNARVNEKPYSYVMIRETGLTCRTLAPAAQSAASQTDAFAAAAPVTTGARVSHTGQTRISFRVGTQNFSRLVEANANTVQLRDELLTAIRDREIREGDILANERKVRTCEFRWRNPDNRGEGVVRVSAGSTYERQCNMARIQSRGGRERVRDFQEEIADLQLAARNGDAEAMEELHELGCSESLPRDLKNIAMASYLTGEVMNDLRSTFTENCRRQGQDMNCDRNIMLSAGAIGNEASAVFGQLGARRNADVRDIADYTMTRAVGVQDSWQSSAIALAVAESISTNRAPGAGLTQYAGNDDNRNVIDNSLGLRMTRAQGSVSPQGLPSLTYQGLNPATVMPTRGQGTIVRL